MIPTFALWKGVYSPLVCSIYIYMYINLSTYLSFLHCLSSYPSIHPFIHPSIYLSTLPYSTLLYSTLLYCLQPYSPLLYPTCLSIIHLRFWCYNYLCSIYLTTSIYMPIYSIYYVPMHASLLHPPILLPRSFLSYLTSTLLFWPLLSQLFFYLLISLSLFPSIYLSFYLSIYLSVYLSIYSILFYSILCFSILFYSILG